MKLAINDSGEYGLAVIGERRLLSIARSGCRIKRPQN
jgi:hypothetical protein